MTNEEIAQISAAVTAQLAARGPQPAAPGWGAPAPAGWGAAPAPIAPIGAAPMGSDAGPTGVLVPIQLGAPDGSTVSMYLQFGPAAASNPQAIMSLLGSLAAAGVPLKLWRPKQEGWGGGHGGGGGGYNGGGYQRNGNGYGGGGGGGWGGGGRRW